MDSICKMTPWLVAIFCLVTAGCTNPMDQQTSETSHDQQVAILKQIRKVNDDGSYTFGYEAGDGSFKVESRDVLGNIKGTFGFVDAEGEIKRVSYSSSNGTGFRATTVPPLQEQVSVVQSIPRAQNVTTTTRKPSIIYATEASARSSVVQTIPRHRKTTTTSSTTTTTTTSSTTSASPTVTASKSAAYYNQYVKAAPSRSRQRFTVQQRAPLVVEEEVPEVDEDSQINRPSVTEVKEAPLPRRILYTKRPSVVPNHELRPITEEFEDREEETKITTGNTLRRQLSQDETKSDSESEAIDEHADVYGGALTVSRPLFTTSTPPRVVQRTNGLRIERPKTIYVNQNNLGAVKFERDREQKLEEQQRAYEEDAQASQEERNSQQQQQQVIFRAPQRAQTIAQASRDYARQSSEPVYVREDPSQPQFLGEVPPEGIIVEARRTIGSENDGDQGAMSFRPVPLGRIIFRPLPNHHPLYQNPPDPSQMRYLADPAPAEHLGALRGQPNPNYFRPHSRPASLPRPLPYPEDEQQSIGEAEAPDYPPAQDYVYRSSSNVPLPPPEPSNPITPPLSRRDFQILLRRLLISQYGPRALAYPRTYLEDTLYDQQPYPTYQNEYAAPSSPLPMSINYGERLAVQPSQPLRRPTVSRALNPVYQPNRYEDYRDTPVAYPKRIYRQKFYPQEPSELDNEEVLPPSVREALLIRMLHLAINPDRPIMPAPIPVMAATNPPSSAYRYRKMGPIRNVQIISNDDDDDNDDEKEISRGKSI